MKKGIIAALVAVLSIGSVQAEKLVIKGSDTLGAKLVPQIAEAFKAKHPGTTFEIAAEGSTTGIAAIIDGSADIGMASRRAKSKEVTAALAKGVKMKPSIACLDGIAVIVNKSNSVGALTLSQIEAIFTGAVTDWSAVGGKGGKISVYTRNTSSGTYSVFKKLAMSKKDYGSNSQKMAGNEQIASEVSKNPSGIGYVGLAYLDGVKAVAVDGVKPSEATVKSMQYPIARPTFYYTNGAPKGLAKTFIDFATGPSGAAIVRKVGFVPAK